MEIIHYKINLKNLIEPNKNVSFQLLFRMSRDGENFNVFHQLCDNQGPTVTLLQLEDNNLLGFYTPLNWNTSSSWIYDPGMFHFSLTKNIKCMKNKNNSSGMFCYQGYGPYTDFFKFCSSMKKPIINPFAKTYENCQNLYPGKKEGIYKCLEIEIFKILYG